MGYAWNKEAKAATFLDAGDRGKATEPALSR
jgi:hypothetical protein